MADAWKYVDILGYFPQVFRGDEVCIVVEGQLLTYEDALQKWRTYCASTRESSTTEQEKNKHPPTKDALVRVLLDSPARKTRKTNSKAASTCRKN